MAPYALCTNPSCLFVFDFGETDSEEPAASLVPPANCPRCNSGLLLHCPICFASIAHVPTHIGRHCLYCRNSLFRSGAATA